MRTRAGLLLSAAAITTSFLGAQALNDGGSGLLTWLALGCFVGLAIATLAILWPHSLEFTANPANVIANYIETEEPLSVSEIHRDLSLHMHRSYGDNLAGQQQLASFSLDQRASDRRGNPMDYRFGFEGVEFDLCMDL